MERLFAVNILPWSRIHLLSKLVPKLFCLFALRIGSGKHFSGIFTVNRPSLHLHAPSGGRPGCTLPLFPIQLGSVLFDFSIYSRFILCNFFILRIGEKCTVHYYMFIYFLEISRKKKTIQSRCSANTLISGDSIRMPDVILTAPAVR